MTRILITGGAGFLGLHLGRKLARDGASVDLLDDLSRGTGDPELEAAARLPGVRLLLGDLGAEPRGLRRDYAVIYHLAAIVGVARVLKDPYRVLRDNVRLTERALEVAAGQKRLERFVFASTSEVYAGTLQHYGLRFPTPEETPLALTPLDSPRTSYMLSKIVGESLCRYSGVPFTIVRPHNVYGPRMGMAHVIPEMLARVHAARPGTRLPVPSARHRRTFCYVEDAVEMLAAIPGRARCRNQTLNVGTEKPEVSIGALARLILRVVGKRMTIVPQPATAGSPVRRAPDMGRARALLGYRSRVGLEEGVRRTYDWYRTRGFGGSR